MRQPIFVGWSAHDFPTIDPPTFCCCSFSTPPWDKISSDQFTLVMNAVSRGWKKLPIYIIYIYICRDLVMNQPGFHGMSVVGFVAVAQKFEQRGGAVSSKSY